MSTNNNSGHEKSVVFNDLGKGFLLFQNVKLELKITSLVVILCIYV